jgi:hypothetical protein
LLLHLRHAVCKVRTLKFITKNVHLHLDTLFLLLLLLLLLLVTYFNILFTFSYNGMDILLCQNMF